MSADQFLTLDERPTVRVERRYPHPIEKVWRAVTTPEHLGQWFPSPVDIDLRPGGPMRFRAFEDDPAAHRHDRGGRRSAPARRSRGARDRLTFELTPDGDGTTFALTHSFDDRCGAASFATGWEICLGEPAQRARRRAAAAGRIAGSPATRSWSTSSGSTSRR